MEIPEVTAMSRYRCAIEKLGALVGENHEA
jgi:hypothetical protein